MRILLALVVLAGALDATAARNAPAPVVKWRYAAQSSLYTSPLTADVHPAAGLETIACDSAVRCVLCIDAAGRELWRFDGGWKKRLIAPPALSGPGPDGARLLLVCNADGQAVCIDAATGAERWRQTPGAVEWSGGLWADLDGDGAEEAVVATVSAGVIVYTRDGRERWRYQHGEGRSPLHIRGPVAAGDVDGDGRCELFGVTRHGVFSLGGDGQLRWERLTWDEFESAVALAAYPEGCLMFALSRHDHAAWAFDAATGAIAWRAALMDAPSPAFAVGPDGIAVADKSGTVSAWNPDGTLRWRFQTAGAAPAGVTMGDVDGDRRPEVLAASGDHFLYCLDGGGRLAWKFETGLRLIAPATINDVDGDGKTDVLVAGGDGALQCLDVNAPYHAEGMPWPMQGADAARRAMYTPTKIATVETPVELLAFGGFEEGKISEGLDVPAKDSEAYKIRQALPRGWTYEAERAVLEALTSPTSPTTWQRVNEHAREGQWALCVSSPMTIISEPARLADDAGAMHARVYVRGDGAEAALVFTSDSGEVRRVPLTATVDADGWRLLQADAPALPGWNAQLALTTGAGGAYWDDASIQAVVREAVVAEVLANQVGYDLGAPKTFIVQTNCAAVSGTFTVRRGDETVFTGPLECRGRIAGCYGNDWGYFYWRGDFSRFDEPGAYTIVATLRDGQTPAVEATGTSYAFEIGADVLWRMTAEPATRFFYYQRCGCAVPGYHEACHLDDAAGPDGTQYVLWGGWHDAGDYNTYTNAPYVHGLLRAYAVYPAGFDGLDTDGNQRADLLDEILWGADHERRMIAPDGSAFGAITAGYGFWSAAHLETDNTPGTGDERSITGQTMGNDPSNHHAAMAKMALYAPAAEGIPAWAEPAARALEWALAHNARGAAQFATALDLHKATGDEKYAALARELFPASLSADPLLVEAVLEFDHRFGGDHREAVKQAVTARAEELLAMAKNPFGIRTFGSPEKPNFFNTPKDQGGWRVGTNSHLLEGAEAVALAWQFQRDPRYLAFVYDQFNWILGGNPFRISMMEGVGDAFLPSYHHRYTFGGVPRGAVPGGIPNGMTCKGVGDDRPSLDISGADIPAFESNEVWLPHNTNYLKALARLMRAKASQ